MWRVNVYDATTAAVAAPTTTTETSEKAKTARPTV